MAQAPKTKKIFDGRYEILSIVGRGARSVVYHARYVSAPHNEVALKVLLDQNGKSPSSERLRREALAMVSSRHRYVVRLDDFHSVGSLCYLSMEFARESDLRAYARKSGGKLVPTQGERFLRQSAEALSAVYRAGILHRDVKPDNILVLNDKEVRLTDFGVALLPGEEYSVADLQSGIGTMNYMAPELLEGKTVDHRSDLYALGVVFYEMLSAVSPFGDVPLAKQVEARQDKNLLSIENIVPELPSYLAEAIMRCVRYSPEDRFQSADELVRFLLDNRSKTFEQQRQGKSPRKKDRSKKERRASQVDVQPVDVAEPAQEAACSDIYQAGTSELEPEKETQSQVIDLFSQDPPAEQPAAAEPAVGEPTVAESVPAAEQTSKPVSSDTTPEKNPEPALEPAQARPAPMPVPVMAPRQTRRETRSMIRRKKPALAVRLGAAAVAGVICIYLALPEFKPVRTGGKTDIQTSSSAAAAVPAVIGSDFSFPHLPSGLFAGAIEDLTAPGRRQPLTLLSLADRNELAVIVGLEGWTPVTVELPSEAATQDSPKLRVSSNGIVLELTGKNVDGELIGFFRNISTGTKGKWSARPIQN